MFASPIYSNFAAKPNTAAAAGDISAGSTQAMKHAFKESGPPENNGFRKCCSLLAGILDGAERSLIPNKSQNRSYRPLRPLSLFAHLYHPQLSIHHSLQPHLRPIPTIVLYFPQPLYQQHFLSSTRAITSRTSHPE
jgi:hypothetical protein